MGNDLAHLDRGAVSGDLEDLALALRTCPDELWEERLYPLDPTDRGGVDTDRATGDSSRESLIKWRFWV